MVVLASWRNCSMFWTELLLLNGFGSVLGSLEEPEEASSVNPHCGPQLHSPGFNSQSHRRGAGAEGAPRGAHLLCHRTGIYITSLVLGFSRTKAFHLLLHLSLVLSKLLLMRTPSIPHQECVCVCVPMTQQLTCRPWSVPALELLQRSSFWADSSPTGLTKLAEREGANTA